MTSHLGPMFERWAAARHLWDGRKHLANSKLAKTARLFLDTLEDLKAAQLEITRLREAAAPLRQTEPAASSSTTTQ